MDYEGFLARRLGIDPQPGVDLVGHSGFFAKPQPGFDSRLLDEHMNFKPRVRDAILKVLYDFWSKRYERPQTWSKVWVAGSALSHQWAADRGGVGDLDVLVGVDHAKLIQYNPEFRGIPEPLIDRRFNAEFQQLMATTRTWKMPGWSGAYELTFYVNPRATDIRDIHPYAAYNLSDNEWTVKPVELPDDWDPYTYFPQEWWAQVNAETNRAREIVKRYHDQTTQVGSMTPASPQWVNAMRATESTIEQASAMFEDIHSGRKNAFGPNGNGYADYYNFRWQAHKLAGTTDALRKIRVMANNAVLDTNDEKYGTRILGNDEATLKASLSATRYRRNPFLVPKGQ